MNCFYHLSNLLSSRLLTKLWSETNLLFVNLIKVSVILDTLYGGNVLF